MSNTTFHQICTGEDPWTALGNFANAWYDYAKSICAALVSEPLGKPEADTEHIRQWGAFIRALDSGGMVWEGRVVYATLESALQVLDDALAAWMKEHVGHE